ncbi:MAG TPA: hypothetical protein VFS40_11565 [Gemmatimonadales bacterium]|nr:hypothetical protein [Gemmatimonadales bacterium]
MACTIARHRGLCATASLWLLAGCAPAWQPVAPAPPRRLAATQAVRLWRQGEEVTLRAVRLTADSVTGVPWRLDPGCAACRVGYALAELDSLRTGRTDLRSVGAVAATAAIMVILGIGIERSFGPD